MTKEIDHSYTDKPTCPYCGKTWSDDDSYVEQSSKEDYCPECGKKFLIHANYQITYSTVKAECLNTGEHVWEHKRWNDWNGDKYFRCKECAKYEYRKN